VGLYASIAPLLLYTVLGTSRVLAVGPVAVVSLMTATAIAEHAVIGSAHYAAVAITLAFLSGAMLLLMGVLRLGFLASFLSHPVISGFITASALLIAAGQLKVILGVKVEGHNFFELVAGLVNQLAHVHAVTAALGLSMVAFLFWARRWLKPLLLFWGLPARLADALAKAGVKRITGTIVGDDRRYDALRYVPSWPERFSTVQHQTGPLSALAVNDGFVSWKPYKDAGDGLSVPAPDPAKQGAEVFTQQLAQRGVVVGGPARSGAAPAAGTVELAGLDSPTIEGLVAEMLSASDNSTAELLFKEAGRVATGTGSTASGVAAAKKALQAAGVPTAGVVTVDGSGLDPTNKVTCDLLTALLDKAGPTSATAKGLPVAGRTGTLRLRMKNTPAEGRLMAKTGTLSTASSLAGFAPRNDGRTITFAFVANKAVLATETVQALQDRMGAELVAATGVPTLEQLAPPTPG
jgi:hypothetical protein